MSQKDAQDPNQKSMKVPLNFKVDLWDFFLFVKNGKLCIKLKNDENQNQQESNFFTSESSSIQIPARKVKVEIEYKLLKNGIVIYECKMCPAPKFLTNFKIWG